MVYYLYERKRLYTISVFSFDVLKKKDKVKKEEASKQI